MPTMATGRIGTSNSRAIRTAPLRSSPSLPSVLRVPSGNTSRLDPAPSTACAPSTSPEYPPPLRCTGTAPMATLSPTRIHRFSNQ